MTHSPHIKPLALTMGEPAGIGPELIARLWQERAAHALSPFVYVGAAEAIRAAVPDIPILPVETAEEAAVTFTKALPYLPVGLPEQVTLGKPSQDNGLSVINSIRRATELALQGAVSGVVTAPIHKAVLYKTGFNAPGHTEFLARLCGEADDFSVMMLTAQDLRVVPVTIHIPLQDVPKQLTSKRIFHAGMILNQDLERRFGIKAPRIAVAGLNPHAGESGTIGMEEATHLMPAIWDLREHGVDVSDPLPADTLFHAAARQQYDAVLCMYHDQALIPVKTLDFWGGVNATLGLPIIRTSPDHGTAFDLAGTGKARIDSMLAAVKLAEQMACMSEANHD